MPLNISPTASSGSFGKGGVDVRVKDDGRGFVRSDNSRGRLGLGIMDERVRTIGASLRVRSKPAFGTTVDVHWRK